MASPGIRAALGLVLLSLALVLLVPPFGGPDEADHHTRIQGVASGTLAGPPAEPPDAGLTARQRPWVAQTTRAVPVAAGRSAAGGYGCFSASARIGAACLDRVAAPNARTVVAATPVGTYQPLPYLLPAVVARIGTTPAAADRWERLATLVPALALLLAAVALVAPSRLLLAGLLLAASPAALAVAAGLGGSGLEVCAAIAVVAALLTPVVVPERARAALVLLAVAAPALVLARALGPVWLLVLLAVCLPPARAWLTAAGVRRLAVPGAAAAVAVGVQRGWEGTYGATPPEYGIPPALESLRAGVRQLPDTLREGVGADGYLQLLAPWPIAATWLALVAVLVLAAVAAPGTWRPRVHVAVVTVAALAAAPVLFAVATRFTGFGVQGRHVLPLLAAVPLVAATALAGTRSVGARAFGGLLATLVPLVAGGVHLAMALVLAHRYAVGTGGPVWFVDEGWAPPGGWPAVLAAVVAGAALVAGAGLGPRPFSFRRPGSTAAPDAPAPPVPR